MKATSHYVTVKLEELFLSLPVESEMGMPTLPSHIVVACFFVPAGVKLLQLCSLMILAEPGFRCFASMTLCVLVKSTMQ